MEEGQINAAFSLSMTQRWAKKGVPLKTSKPLTFLVSVNGDKWVQTYLGALLQSIDELYGDSCRVVINYNDVSIPVLAEAQRKLPYAKFKTSKIKIPKTGVDSNLMDMWTELLEGVNDENLVFLDADMIILKDISKFFEDSFDVGYTYYHNHITSHGDAGKTPSGKHTRINSGVVLVKNREKGLQLFRTWKDLTNDLIKSKKKKQGLFPKLRRLMNPIARNDHKYLPWAEWGSIDQASLSSILKTDDHSATITRDEVQLKGSPCALLNETECRPISKETHIIHYKAGWRPILPDGTFDQVLEVLKPVRNEALCGEQYQIWKGFYERWNER